MLIRAGYEIRFECEVPTPMLAMLSIHPSRNKDLTTAHRILTDPDVPIYDYLDAYGNVCSRVTVPTGGLTLACDFVVEDAGEPDCMAPDASQHAIEDLPDDVLIYLLGSRYCETDRLSDVAWSRFGHIPEGWMRVQEIMAFTHDHIEFGYHHARANRTAWDAYQEQRGVCRDFAHLAVALCRCMNIPARYCTGYLGDIGVPPGEAPMDFAAWFEVYLGGSWHVFDARHNAPRIGRILMARGRDATDTALTTSFGPSILSHFAVHTDEVTALA
ncbi:MAG TPA: transglutaminase family protein [Sphingobium sp.]|uniref:transglutaminase-like domain-containing protein n=1 Tax=Sphingobium sp. TaxID=1912891 RepID=UPI002ED448A8